MLTLTDAGVGGAGHSGGARYVLAAARYERLAKDLGPWTSSEQMAKSVAEYASVLTSSGKPLRSLGAALDSNNLSEADRANHELEAADHPRAQRRVADGCLCQPE